MNATAFEIEQKVEAFSQELTDLAGIPISLSWRTMGSAAPRIPTQEEVLLVVKEKYPEFTKERLTERCRKREFIEPKQIYIALLWKFGKYSKKELGKTAGGYDHSTVIHCIQTVQDRVDTEKAYAARWIMMCNDLKLICNL